MGHRASSPDMAKFWLKTSASLRFLLTVTAL
jgi:hypothetical protein